MYIYLPVAEISVFSPVLLSVSMLIGILAGLLGISGGFLLTPFMIALGIPAHIAVGSTGGQVFASSFSAFATYHKHKSIDYKLVFYLTIGGAVGMVGGLGVFHILSQMGNIEDILRIAFMVLLSATGLFMGLKAPRSETQKPDTARTAASENTTDKSVFSYKIYFEKSNCYINIFGLSIISIIIGFIAGLLGVGGGFLLVPALIYILRLDSHHALPVAQTNIMIISGIGLFLHSYFSHNVDTVLSLLLVVSGVTGSMIGTRFSQKISKKIMRLIFSGVLISTAMYLVVDSYVINNDNPVYMFTEIVKTQRDTLQNLFYMLANDYAILNSLLIIISATLLSYTIRFIFRKS